MNSVNLVGRLTKDPEIRVGQMSQKAVASFSLAVNRAVKDQGADFINCVAFGKTAELMEKYCGKGQMLGVTGRIQTGSYEKDGRKVYTTNIVADRIEFLSKSEKSPSESESSASGFTPFSHSEDVDILF